MSPTPEDPFAGSDVTILRPRPGRRGTGSREHVGGCAVSRRHLHSR